MERFGTYHNCSALISYKVQLFVSARDVRFGISYPGCYRAIVFALPLAISSTLESGTQVLRLASYPDNISGFTTVCNFALQFIIIRHMRDCMDLFLNLLEEG